MITKQEAYERTVRVKSQATLINIKLELIESLIEQAISNGEFDIFFNIQHNEITYESIKNILTEKNFKLSFCYDPHSLGMLIDWSSDD